MQQKQKRIKKTGIYVFESLIPGEKYGQKYVGQCELEISVRERRHWNELKQKKHCNPKLQRFYNKYGKQALKFTFIMECDKSELNFWEEFYVKVFDSYKNGFNCTKGGDKIGDSFQKQCTFTNMITGETVTCNSIKEFAIKYNLRESSVSLLYTGKRKYLYNWYCPNNKTNWEPKWCNVIDPNGNEHKILYHTINEFCRLHNLEDGSFRKMVLGQSQFYLNWKGPNSFLQDPPCSKKFELISPKGEIVKGANVRRFCRENNLNDSCLLSVLKGGQSHHKGWKKYKEEIL
jgi:hypothetical protein